MLPSMGSQRVRHNRVTKLTMKAGVFHVALVVKNLPASAKGIRDAGSIPRWGRSPGGGLGNALQYSCLENPMDRGAGVTKGRTRLK